MSYDSLGQFPVENISMKANSWMFLGFAGIFFHSERISSFFSGLQSSSQSQLSSSNDFAGENKRDANLSTKQEKKHVQTINRGEAEYVLKSLGMFCNSDETNLPARLDVDQIFNMFEEENPRLEEVKEAFDVFDKNGDGFIDAKELQNVLCALGLNEGLEMENCRRMIGAFDENGDGRIDFHEFAQFMETSFC